MWNDGSPFTRYRPHQGASTRARSLFPLAGTLVVACSLLAAGPARSPADTVGPRLPGQAAPDLARLFTPRNAPPDSYRVTTLPWAIEQARQAVMRALAPSARLDEPSGAWRVERADPLEAFGKAGPYDRFALERLYAGAGVSVVHAPITRRGKTVASVTLFSPYPDASLSHLEPGTLVILFDATLVPR